MNQSEINSTLEIMNLFSRYGQIFDNKDTDNIDELVDLFTEDCRISYDRSGIYEGHEEYRQFAEEYIGGHTTNTDWFHQFTNPWIDVNGDTAKGKWNFVGYYIFEETGATWQVGFYEVDFVRESSGEWKIDKLQLELKFSSPYEDGWALTPKAEELR